MNVDPLWLGDAISRQSLVHAMACRLLATKSLPKQCWLHICQCYPGYSWEPNWKSMGPEISRVAWQFCDTISETGAPNKTHRKLHSCSRYRSKVAEVDKSSRSRQDVLDERGGRSDQKLAWEIEGRSGLFGAADKWGQQPACSSFGATSYKGELPTRHITQ